ncbi:hypothetical protein DLM75_00095 [Leptospira stimsonii]|uniref:Uncharacterized protein n=1 Tax=Leptospira stimsonii TaxID=2202203 RepID=A0A396Z8G0_9LEPT|nr:hypothetical protein DLM75_00095 [Leptospira stimsonii]
MHFIQCLLLEFSVLLFSILLLSLTEHIPFNVSYWISCSLKLAFATLLQGCFSRGNWFFSWQSESY